MFSLFRPFIFKLDPERAHNLAIKALKTNILPSNKKHTFKSLNSSFLGKKISNPIGLAAGFDKDAEVYNSMYKLGFGFVEVGTVTPKSQHGNPKPRMFRLEKDRAKPLSLRRDKNALKEEDNGLKPFSRIKARKEIAAAVARVEARRHQTSQNTKQSTENE